MKDQIGPFKGFSKDAFSFLKELGENNCVEWFNENRSRYQDSLVQPARSFITEMGEFFNRLYPAIRTEPKFNETIMRINKDMRFSKGAPYRDYFLIHFGRFKMDSEFYVSFEAESFDIGLFINNSREHKEFHFADNITRYKKEFFRVVEKYGIDYDFELLELKKGPVSLDKHFSAEKHYEPLKSIEYILLEKPMKPNRRIIFSPDFVIEAIKIYSNLYPLYCFAAFSNPLKMIEEYEENFGFLI